MRWLVRSLTVDRRSWVADEGGPPRWREGIEHSGHLARSGRARVSGAGRERRRWAREDPHSDRVGDRDRSRDRGRRDDPDPHGPLVPAVRENDALMHPVEPYTRTRGGDLRG